jgi:hypothetical protein
MALDEVELSLASLQVRKEPPKYGLVGAPLSPHFFGLQMSCFEKDMTGNLHPIHHENANQR